MHPQFLPENEDHSFWQEKDIFPDHRLDCIHAVLVDHTLSGMHAHNFYEISIILQGEGWHYIEGQIYPAQRGCVLTMPPNIRHGYYSEQSMTVYNFLIRPEFFVRYHDEIHALPGSAVLFEIEPYLRSKFDRAVFVTLDDPQIQELYPNLSQLLHYCEHSETGLTPLKNALAILIVGYLSGQFLHSRPTLDSHRKDTTTSVLGVMEYLHRHYSEKISVDTLARQANLSRTAFYQHFFELNRCSVIQYLTNYRLQQSLSLLLSTTSSVAEIAQECGFYDSSHYIRTFLREYHMTPQQYRSMQHASSEE